MVSRDWQGQIFEKKKKKIKKMATWFWAKWAKIGPKTRFIAIFSSLVH